VGHGGCDIVSTTIYADPGGTQKKWAALIMQVYEKDPLLCPKCGCEMKRIALIEPGQSKVIEKILRHCGLWNEDPARAPPPPEELVEG